MTRHPAPAAMCVDIHRWMTHLDDAATATAGGPPRAVRRSSAPAERLPFGLAARLDELDEGMAGAKSAQGITVILAGWADAVASLRGETRTLPPAVYLAATVHWWTAEYGDADALLDDLTTCWDRLARLTGHTDQADPGHRCPACGGALFQAATDRGLTDWRTCAACDTWWPDGRTIDAARRHTITTTTTGTHWVTRQHALTIHPSLTAATLRQWVRRGHVAARGSLVNLVDINQRLADKEARA